MTGDLLTTLNSSFRDILGRTSDTYTESERRQRWAQWLRTCRRSGDPEIARAWTENHECHGCIHRRGYWCSLMELPCTVNPILSFRFGMTGMACMGTGYESADTSTQTCSQNPDDLNTSA